MQPDPDGLSDRERESLSGVRNVEVRTRRIVGWNVLRRLTAAVSGMTEETLKQAGEPGLIFRDRSARAWYGSLTHSGSVMLAAVSAEVIPGVDIERVWFRQHYRKLAERYFTAAESAWIDEAAIPGSEGVDPGMIRFLKLWTRREAVVKALGVGVARGFPRFSVPAADGLTESVRIPYSDCDHVGGPVWLRDIVDIPEGMIAALAWRPKDGTVVTPWRPGPE